MPRVSRLMIGAVSVDVAVSALGLHHCSAPATAFKEIARMLRSDGVALVYDLRRFAYLRHEIRLVKPSEA